MISPEPNEPKRRPPLQFRLRTLMLATAAIALLFGTLEGFDISPRSAFFVLGILAASGLAALGFVVVVATSVKQD